MSLLTHFAVKGKEVFKTDIPGHVLALLLKIVLISIFVHLTVTHVAQDTTSIKFSVCKQG